MKKLAEMIRDIPDFPKKGIIFKDITTLWQDKEGFKKSVDDMAAYYRFLFKTYLITTKEGFEKTFNEWENEKKDN